MGSCSAATNECHRVGSQFAMKFSLIIVFELSSPIIFSHVTFHENPNI
jgi:hypothetical protein